MSALSEFLKNVNEGYMVVNQEGKIIYANDFLIKKGILRENHENKFYYEGSNLLSLISALAEAINEKKRIKRFFEYREVEYAVEVFPVGNEVLVKLTDITQIKRYERSKKEFVANVSHELKTPITVIKSILETLLEEEKDQEKRKLLERALKRTEEMRNLVEDLLIIAKLESGEEKLHKRKLLLKENVDVVFDVLRDIAKGRSIRLVNSVDERLEVYADEDKLSLLLLNLVDNAIKYNREEGRVEVGAYIQNNYTVIEVKDTGIGIPKEHMPFIFERFYMVEKSRSREMGGTGLGLSIVKHIALSHGGKVDVESVEGLGSTFRVYLPHSV
ncbi:MAG: ATP-binding protein [Aquificaceae bacterium]